jgi:cell division protein FtsW
MTDSRDAVTTQASLSSAPSAFVSYGGQTLWFPVVALMSFGLLFVYSASSVYAAQKFGDEFLFVKKQLIYVVPGVAAAFIGARLPVSFLRRVAPALFLFALVATFLTKVPGIGKSVKGAARWLALGPMQIQPSEFLKITTVLFAAFVLERTPHKLHRLWPAGLALFALLLQPDFGSMVILCLGMAGIVFLHGVPKRVFFGAFALALPALGAVMIAEPYRVRRLVTFLDPFADPLGAGFQVIQSFVAIASGGLLGKGLGGSQQKLFFLPEAHTDFILAVIGEEMGFIGIATLMLIYALFFYTVLQIVTHARTSAERLLAAGIFAMLAGSTLVNMGVVAGLLPTKGLTLPFISAGGSSLVANLFMVGLLSRVHRDALMARNALPARG